MSAQAQHYRGLPTYVLQQIVQNGVHVSKIKTNRAYGYLQSNWMLSRSSIIQARSQLRRKAGRRIVLEKRVRILSKIITNTNGSTFVTFALGEKRGQGGEGGGGGGEGSRSSLQFAAIHCFVHLALPFCRNGQRQLRGITRSGIILGEVRMSEGISCRHPFVRPQNQ